MEEPLEIPSEQQDVVERPEPEIEDSASSNSTRPNGLDCDALYKLVLIGDSNAGKSSLLLRFSENRFLTDVSSFHLCSQTHQGSNSFVQLLVSNSLRKILT